VVFRVMCIFCLCILFLSFFIAVASVCVFMCSCIVPIRVLFTLQGFVFLKAAFE